MKAGLLPPSVSPPGGAGFAIVRCLYGPRPERRARRLAVQTLEAAGLRDELPDIELAVSELVANARQHAPGPYELRIILQPALVTVAVVDGGADHLELVHKLTRAAAGEMAEGESGRGLQIVTGLFPGCWGAGPATTCTGAAPAKQVWITVGRGSRSQPSGASGGRGRS